MNQVELAIKKNDNTKNEIAEKLELVSNTNIKTKEELIQQMIAKDNVKNPTMNVARKMFIQKEKELDESHQMINNYEIYISDDKIKSDVLNKVLQKRENQNETDYFHKIKSIRWFFININKCKRELPLKAIELFLIFC